MSEQLGQSATLHIKCDSLKCARELLSLWLLIFLVEFLIFIPLVQGFCHGLTLLNLSLLIIGIIFIDLLLLRFIFYRPGQGDLFLSSKGFRLINHFKQSTEYPWEDINGFYHANDGLQKKVPRVFCNFLNRKALAFPRFYEVSSEELLSILNQWKNKYNPNSVIIELNPVLKLTKISKIITYLFEIKNQVSICILIVSLIKLIFFDKTEIFIVNNTKMPIKNIQAVGTDSLFKQLRPFEIKSLSAGQSLAIQIPHFDEEGGIQFIYDGDKTYCGYLQRTQCEWQSGEQIYIESHGKLASNNRICSHSSRRAPSEKLYDQMVISPCRELEVEFSKIGYKMIDPVNVESKPVVQDLSNVVINNSQGATALLESEIKKHWHPPNVLEVWTTKVRLKSFGNGPITITSSHNAEWDRTSLEAIQDIGTIEAYTIGLPMNSIIEVTFNYYPMNSVHKSKVTAEILSKSENE